MNPFDDLWVRVKAVAEEWAAAGRALPDHTESVEEVRALIKQVLGEHAIPDLAIEYYAAELCGFIERRRRFHDDTAV